MIVPSARLFEHSILIVVFNRYLFYCHEEEGRRRSTSEHATVLWLRRTVQHHLSPPRVSYFALPWCGSVRAATYEENMDDHSST